MSRSESQRIADILDAAAELAQIVSRGHEEFSSNTILQRAAERLLEIIGEAATAIAHETAAAYPAVAWHDIARLRIVLAHHYHRVDPDQVWVIACNEVPKRLPTSNRVPPPRPTDSTSSQAVRAVARPQCGRDHYVAAVEETPSPGLYEALLTERLQRLVGGLPDALHADLQDLAGAESSVFEGTSREADLALAELITKASRGGVSVGTRTVADAIEAGLQQAAFEGLEPTPVRNYRTAANNHVLPALGSKRLSHLTAEHLDRVYGALVDAGYFSPPVRGRHQPPKRCPVAMP